MSFKHKRISADEAISKAAGRVRETSRGPMLLKAMGAPSTWDQKARSTRFVMTTEQIDRYGDIVVTDGIDTMEFERNPVALLMHDNRSWPIGNWANLEKLTNSRPPRMEGDCVLLPAGGPVAVIDETAWMLENGGIRGASIGFLPVWDEVEMILDEDQQWTGGLRFGQSELVECSICGVPANSGALAKAIAEGHGMAKEALDQILDTWAKTPDGIIVPRSEFEAVYSLTKKATVAVTRDDGEDDPTCDPDHPCDDPECETCKPKKSAPAEPVAPVGGSKMADFVEAVAQRVGKMFGLSKSEPKPESAAPSAEEIAGAKAASAAARALIAARVG